MILKNILFTSLFVSGLVFSAKSQTIDEGFSFSQETNGGTARMKGLGNAKTALGGDISSITGNPAGLGFFRQSDISVTASYNNAGNKSTYFGTKTSKNKDRFGIDHAGVVFHFPQNEGYSGWQNFNIGLSYENTNRFNNNVRYEGVNPDNTIVSAYTDEIYTTDNNDFAKGLSNLKLIERFADANEGYFPITNEMSDKTQISDVLTKGYSSRTSLAFGSNYNNKLYIGATLGFSSFQRDDSDQFSEFGWTKDLSAVKNDNPQSDFIKPTNENYKYLDKNYELLDDHFVRSEGTGIDFKIGLIYKPTVDWNLGATITSPTWYTIDRVAEDYIGIDYYADENANTAFDGNNLTYQDLDYTYRLTTPWKFALGVSKFFGRGLLTADAEYIDYGTTKFHASGYDDPTWEDQQNKGMKDSYQAVVNLRVGGEFLFSNVFSGRAGFNYFGNPYKNADNKQYSGSLGLGAKITETLYLDLAVVHLINDYKASRYLVAEDLWGSNTQVAEIKHRRTNAVLTFGVKF